MLRSARREILRYARNDKNGEGRMTETKKAGWQEWRKRDGKNGESRMTETKKAESQEWRRQNDENGEGRIASDERFGHDYQMLLATCALETGRAVVCCNI